MLLTVDIGNTSIGFGVFDKEELIDDFALSSGIQRTADEYGMLLIDMLERTSMPIRMIDGAIICSVVPSLTSPVVSSIRKYLKLEPMILSPGAKTGVSVRYDNPKEIGTDRIALAAGGLNIYGSGLLIIDFDTATTYEYIDEKGTYRGGCIAPGLKISIDALSENASKLPAVELKPMQSVITSDTVSAMQAGIYFSFIGSVEYLIDRFRKEIGKSIKVIATGRLGKAIAKSTEKIDIYDEKLIYRGLRIIYEKNKGK